MENKYKKITVMIPMRDSIRLATDIYFPEDESVPRPVLIERTPYGRVNRTDYDLETSSPDTFVMKAQAAGFFIEAGFIVCFQDVRGRYDSEGDFDKYIHEASDGVDSLTWIKAQPWCNGQIGLMGYSYTSHAAAAAGCLAPSELSALFIDSGGFSNAYQSGIRQGGVLELKQLLWAFNQGKESPFVSNNPVIRKALDSEDVFAWMTRFPLKKGHSLLRFIPEYEEIVFNYWKNETYADYWKQLGINTSEFYGQFADVPLFLMTGWYDPYVKSIVDNYKALASRKKTPTYLLIGPWTHKNRGLHISGDVDMGNEASIRFDGMKSYQDLKKKWFEFTFSNEHTAFLKHKVNIYIMGGGSGRRTQAGHLSHGGSWTFADEWPLPGVRDTPFYFHKDGSLSTSIPAEVDEFHEYIFDPEHPVPSIGGTITSGEPIMRGGAFNQVEGEEFFGSQKPYLPLESRSDILVYQSEILDNDTTICGEVFVKLWVGSDCKDTDFTFKLIDVYPPSEDYPQGYAMNITDGIQRAKFRVSCEKPELMVPGEVYELQINAFASANLFKEGHRIRVDISSSNFPHFDINHNTGDPDGIGQVLRKALNKVYIDCNRPSHIVLPILGKKGS
ncbi:MAG: CocE/NonD family hydrolase [Erysipelotrichaceae bacterium]|nr:CocE/NonD family hydrolase [Erysipelotrichaceae bacterium]